MLRAMNLVIESASPTAELESLPWDLPLAQWPAHLLAALPRGISRHVVRFVMLPQGNVVAIKETEEPRARHEYNILRTLREHEAPCVQPRALITRRQTSEGKPLGGAILTDYLPFSLPYRTLFSHYQSTQALHKIIDALAVLIVRLHLLGFYWGDISLSNTLFRRDAGEFAAYLVDAETGEIDTHLTTGKRAYDLHVARTNIIGELMDLQAGGLISPDFDVIAVGARFEERYRTLWDQLTAATSFSVNENWRIAERVERLNELGFDVAGFALTAKPAHIRIEPKVVESGHYTRLLRRICGIVAEENQARRLVNDIEHFRTVEGFSGSDEELAQLWQEVVYEPVLRAAPGLWRSRVAGPELFHQFLEHRWYISEQAGHDVPFADALASFAANLRSRLGELPPLAHGSS